MSKDEGKFYCVSLRLCGDSLPIDEIETKIGLKPDTAKKKGEFIHKFRLQTNIWTSGYLTENDIPLEEQIELWLETLEAKKTELLEILSLPNVEGDFFIGIGSTYGQVGAFFSPEILRRISELKLALQFDLYPLNEIENK